MAASGAERLGVVSDQRPGVGEGGGAVAASGDWWLGAVVSDRRLREVRRLAAKAQKLELASYDGGRARLLYQSTGLSQVCGRAAREPSYQVQHLR